MKARKEKKKWWLIIFIVIIMIGTTFSFVFFGFSGVDETVKYNGIKFVRLPDRWEAKINGITAAFSFSPKDVENIVLAQDISSLLSNKLEIDTTSDVNSSFKEPIALAQHQMGLVLSNYNIFLRKGFSTNTSFNLPIITCSNATSNVPVIYFKHGNITQVKAENNCVFAEASSDLDFLRLKDRILYGMLGVMK